MERKYVFGMKQEFHISYGVSEMALKIPLN